MERYSMWCNRFLRKTPFVCYCPFIILAGRTEWHTTILILCHFTRWSHFISFLVPTCIMFRRGTTAGADLDTVTSLADLI